MTRTTLVSALLGIVLTLSVGYQVLSMANGVADRMADRQSATISAMFGE